MQKANKNVKFHGNACYHKDSSNFNNSITTTDKR